MGLCTLGTPCAILPIGLACKDTRCLAAAQCATCILEYSIDTAQDNQPSLSASASSNSQGVRLGLLLC